MESESKHTIIDLKMMMKSEPKSDLEKIVLKFFHAGDYFLLLHGLLSGLKTRVEKSGLKNQG